VTVRAEHPGADPIADFEAINAELEKYSPALAAKPMIVAVTKIDLPFVKESVKKINRYMTKRGMKPLAVSAVTRRGSRNSSTNFKIYPERKSGRLTICD